MGLDKKICPKCESKDTVCVYTFLELALEYRDCENCGCEYEVYYLINVKEINIRN